ncbi:MAG: hypothetical protein D6782_08915 [Alphaproteobacteria bacterium]|nr:MAG: hypothetical protein D6782_08915 [Alphaproteobacteria bacterium]
MTGKLLDRLERFLEQRAMAPSRFGRLVCGDPRLVFDLRRGRRPSTELTVRIDQAIRKIPEVEGQVLQKREITDARFATFHDHLHFYSGTYRPRPNARQ